jgi:hypothetical protein
MQSDLQSDSFTPIACLARDRDCIAQLHQAEQSTSCPLFLTANSPWKCTSAFKTHSLTVNQGEVRFQR